MDLGIRIGRFLALQGAQILRVIDSKCQGLPVREPIKHVIMDNHNMHSL